MPYVPTPTEVARLRSAIEAARFREGERILWLSAFVSLAVVDVFLVIGGASWPGIAASAFGFLILYWRLRGAHLARVSDEKSARLFGLGLASREQRAFTALMLRHVLTGTNPLVPRAEHDPLGAWLRQATTPRQEAAEESS